MKKIYKLCYIFLGVFFLLLSGCSSDDSDATSSGIGGIGGNTGDSGSSNGVTIQVKGQVNGDYYYFYINPNVAINLASVTASVPASSYSETLDINSQFSAGSYQAVIYYNPTAITTGQKWTFKFVGTTASGSQSFSVTVNYTIP